MVATVTPKCYLRICIIWFHIDFRVVKIWDPYIHDIHSSPKETQLFWSCLSFGEECRSVNFGPNFICILFLVTNCQKPHSKIPQCSRTVTWPRVTDPGLGSPWKNLEIKVLLGKSVHSDCKNMQSKINGIWLTYFVLRVVFSLLNKTYICSIYHFHFNFCVQKMIVNIMRGIKWICLQAMSRMDSVVTP